MARLTQIMDYLTRKPEDFSLQFVKEHYTHFSIDHDLKTLRRKLCLWRTEIEPTLF